MVDSKDTIAEITSSCRIIRDLKVVKLDITDPVTGTSLYRIVDNDAQFPQEFPFVLTRESLLQLINDAVEDSV